MSWFCRRMRPSEEDESSASSSFGALASTHLRASARKAASCGVSSKFMALPLVWLCRIPLAHAVDQRVFPIGLAAEPQGERVGAAVVHVTVELPGETHAAVNLDVVLGAVLERLGRADARGRR